MYITASLRCKAGECFVFKLTFQLRFRGMCTCCTRKSMVGDILNILLSVMIHPVPHSVLWRYSKAQLHRRHPYFYSCHFHSYDSPLNFKKYILH